MTAGIMKEGRPAGNLTDKYSTRNPLYRVLMGGFFRSMEELLKEVRDDISTVSEIGCGEGHLAARLASMGFASVRCCDYSEEIIDVARGMNTIQGLTFHVKSIYDTGPEESADLVVCCEVLEHLEDPGTALERLHSLDARYYLLSVPNEPLFRFLNMLRGKYLRSFGNTPGHIQHWTSREFVRLISGRFRVIAKRKPLPWTMVLCERN